MKPHSLETLARLRRQELMELNREMAALSAQQLELENALKRLETELMVEARIAEGDPFARFGTYSQRHRAQSDAVIGELDQIDAEIVELHDLIATAFEAYKTIEQVEASQMNERLALAKRQEQTALDETAGQAAARLNAMH